MSRSRTRKSGGSVGTFFFGSFIGFILCLALLFGLGSFIYFKVSPAWINKTFKTNIDLGNDEVNNLTLRDVVGSVVGFATNADTYTLNTLKDDFGINVSDELFGINISDLKGVPIKELPEAVENKFGTISADELRNVSGMNLEAEMGKILNKENTYYYNVTGNKLYKTYDGSEYTNEVTFKYELNNDKTKVISKGYEALIVSGEVKIPLWYLPLTVALGDFTSNMGESITLKELETDFGVTLPSFFNSVDKENTTVNELEDAIKKLKVADFLGYTIEGGVVKNKGVAVTGILAKIAKYEVENLEQGINDLMLADMFEGKEMTGVLSLIDKPEKVTLTGETDASKGILSISDALSKVIEEKTIDEFISADLVEKPTGYTDVTKLNWIQVKDGSYKQVKDLLLQDVIDVFFDNVDIGSLPSVKPTV